MHLRHFGFPRLLEDDEGSMDSKKNNQTQLKKFLWKKTNFVTDLPKHMPIARYLVAKTSNLKDHFYMHVSILHNEYNPNYKVPSELQKLQEKKQKLFDEDIHPAKEHERLIMCHMLQKDDPSKDKTTQNSAYIGKAYVNRAGCGI